MPKGQWFCDRCKYKRRCAREGLVAAGDEAALACCHFCRQRDGAMKGDRERRLWGHVACVWYDPDALFEDPAKMAPVIFQRPPAPSRGARACAVCHLAEGLTIPCLWPGCDKPVHARCAQRTCTRA